MLLYHGSTVIVDKPRLVQHNRYLDFAFGFYTASNREQIEQFAKKVAQRRGGVPILNMYEIDEVEVKKKLTVRRFSNPTEKWLDFVAQNRLGTYSGEKYDLIVGPVANDDVYLTVQYYLTEVYTKNQALRALKIKQLYDQYVFATEKALAMLKFVASKEL